jgi:hypothetical protein
MTPTNLSLYYDVYPEIAENTGLGHLLGASLRKDLRLNDKYACPKDNSGTCSCVYYKQLYCPCWVIKGGQLSLKGRSIPHIQLPFFYKKGSNPDCTLAACSPVNFTIFNLNYTVWEAGEKSDI